MEQKYKKMTKAQRIAFIEKVEERARERENQLGKEFSSADFFAGAMAAQEAHGKEWAIPGWIFGIMGGRPFWRRENSDTQ